MEQPSKWTKERPWVRDDGVMLQGNLEFPKTTLDHLEIIRDDEERRFDSTSGLTERDFEEFAWLKRVYRGARSNTWWSNMMVASMLGVLMLMLLGFGRLGNDGLLALIFLASFSVFAISLLAIYRSYELFFSIEPEDLTEFSQTHWQSLARTALYFPIYLIVFSIFCAAVGLDGVSTGMNLAYKFNGVIYSLGLYQRMKTLADYLKSETLQRRIGFLNAPFWALMALLAVRLMVEAGFVPIGRMRGVYVTGIAIAAMAIYVNYYLIMKQFGIVIRSRLLDEAHRYKAIRVAYEEDVEDLEEDEEDEERSSGH